MEPGEEGVPEPIMFESKTAPLLSRRAFYARLARSVLVSAAIVAFSLGLGSAGYRYYGGLAWLDALLNAAMILTGMGPVDRMTTSDGKLFAVFYALYSGIAFLTMMAVLTAPVIHRFLHAFHVDDDEE
jgi:hypothetical protein